MDEQPQQSPPQPPPQEPAAQQPSGYNKYAIIAAVVVLLGLFAAGGYWYWAQSPQDSSADLADEQSVTITTSQTSQ